jgi:hypothetical protein
MLGENIILTRKGHPYVALQPATHQRRSTPAAAAAVAADGVAACLSGLLPLLQLLLLLRILLRLPTQLHRLLAAT